MTATAKDQRMAYLRLATVLQDLHDAASDPSSGEPERVDAAHQLGRTLNQHFALVVSGLRSAGGARRP